MSCENCRDTAGLPLFPVYGFAVASSANARDRETGEIDFGKTSYTPDPQNPCMGVFWCAICGEGKPKSKNFV